MNLANFFNYTMEVKAVEDGVFCFVVLINTSSDIKIFVPNIGHDKLSDLTINVIRKHLIEYTKDQMYLHGHIVNQCSVWNLLGHGITLLE